VRVAIVGCGRVGWKRAHALGTDTLVAVADVAVERARRLAGAVPGCTAAGDAGAVVARADVDAVVVATPNAALAPVTLAALEHGKPVLVEKPAARSAAELLPVLAARRAAGVPVKVGFNHRFHPAIERAHALVADGAVGPLMLVRARYGHGGRLGYEREWRADPAVAGGGELLDQGVHLLDLARWFLGEFAEVRGAVATLYWDMPVEDNGFVWLRTADGQVAWLHASCTEWKNLFCLEIYGCHGKLQVDGLGGSYGTERLTHHRMRPEMGPPDTAAWEYPGEDGSWAREWAYFRECVATGRAPEGGLEDALAALSIVERVYADSAGGHPAGPAGGTGARAVRR
jgi:predicted dehydrogenase